MNDMSDQEWEDYVEKANQSPYGFAGWDVVELVQKLAIVIQCTSENEHRTEYKVVFAVPVEHPFLAGEVMELEVNREPWVRMEEAYERKEDSDAPVFTARIFFAAMLRYAGHVAQEGRDLQILDRDQQILVEIRRIIQQFLNSLDAEENHSNYGFIYAAMQKLDHYAFFNTCEAMVWSMWT